MNTAGQHVEYGLPQRLTSYRTSWEKASLMELFRPTGPRTTDWESSHLSIWKYLISFTAVKAVEGDRSKEPTTRLFESTCNRHAGTQPRNTNRLTFDILAVMKNLCWTTSSHLSTFDSILSGCVSYLLLELKPGSNAVQPLMAYFGTPTAPVG